MVHPFPFFSPFWPHAGCWEASFIVSPQHNAYGKCSHKRCGALNQNILPHSVWEIVLVITNRDCIGSSMHNQTDALFLHGQVSLTNQGSYLKWHSPRPSKKNLIKCQSSHQLAGWGMIIVIKPMAHWWKPWKITCAVLSDSFLITHEWLFCQRRYGWDATTDSISSSFEWVAAYRGRPRV